MKHDWEDYSAAINVALIGFGILAAAMWAFIGIVLKFQF